MIALLLKFLLTNVLFSMIIGAALIRIRDIWNRNIDKKTVYDTGQLMLYSLGLGPVFTVLLLYYLLLLLPGQSNLFYIVCILVIYGGIFVFSLKGFYSLISQVRNGLGTLTFSWKTFLYWGFILFLLAGFLFFYLGNTIHTPLEHHDALIYGNLGKMYYQEKEITYRKVMKPGRDGFYFQGSQKPSFSLLLTWEMLLNNRQINQSPDFDLYFRSISGYYGLLFIALCFFWLYRVHKYLALLGLLVLFSGLRFFIMTVDYHLDAYRMFFLMISWIWLGFSIKEKDKFSLLLLGIFTGFTAFTHLIGLAVALFNTMALFIFYEGNLKIRIYKTAVLSVLILLMGNFHYLLEAVFGSVSGFISYISS